MAENETTGPDDFVRNPEVDYSDIPVNPAPDPDEPITPIPGVDPDTAQDSLGESASAVSTEALAHPHGNLQRCLSR